LASRWAISDAMAFDPGVTLILHQLTPTSLEEGGVSP
jgi:hypothetical protein